MQLFKPIYHITMITLQFIKEPTKVDTYMNLLDQWSLHAYLISVDYLFYHQRKDCPGHIFIPEPNTFFFHYAN